MSGTKPRRKPKGKLLTKDNIVTYVAIFLGSGIGAIIADWLMHK